MTFAENSPRVAQEKELQLLVLRPRPAMEFHLVVPDVLIHQHALRNVAATERHMVVRSPTGSVQDTRHPCLVGAGRQERGATWATAAWESQSRQRARDSRDRQRGGGHGRVTTIAQNACATQCNSDVVAVLRASARRTSASNANMVGAESN